MSGHRRTTTFRPRARLVSILGEHLISDHVVGLIELVKNAYDADATRVVVELTGLVSCESTRIVVEDDGRGMTAEDLIEKFLSPAVDHKARMKGEKPLRTPRNRLPLGEKGVGRFAAQQLGRRLELVSRAEGRDEVVTEIDWTAFETGNAFLEDVTLVVEERAPQVFTRTGTRLTITGARCAWGEAEVRKLQRGLRRLRSPHADANLKDFCVELKCPEFPQYESLDQGDLLEKAHYIFHGAVYEDGTMDYEYTCQHPAVKQRKVENGRDLVKDAKEELSGERPVCGTFWLTLYVWDRTAKYLQQSGVNRKDLDAMAGVSLFRDGLRVLPYGEPGDDWLHLDRDRINSPAERIGNNQTVGFIHVFQESSPGLLDKTNREGLIETPAFRDLRAMARAAIATLNNLWLQDRPRDNAIRRGTFEPVRPLQRARKVAAALQQSARPDVLVDLPVDEEGDQGHEAEQCIQLRSVPQTEATKVLIYRLDETRRAAREHDRQQKERHAILLDLAATGMAAERVVHEFGRQVKAALEALAALRRDPSDVARLQVLEACLGTLRNEFRVLAPYEASGRVQRTAALDVREALEVALQLNEELLEKTGAEVTVEGNSFIVKMRPASLIQVFDNLLFNACFWLSSAEAPKQVLVRLIPEAFRVVVADSGPGIAEEVADTLFDPFVTTRPGGRGLGLYIVREILNSAGGRVEVDPVGPLAGANFVLTFPPVHNDRTVR